MQTIPLSQHVASANISGRWHLTHALWKGHAETGVRYLHEVDHTTGRTRFHLIQHGWRDTEKAQAVIVKGLRKRWSPFRISDVMDRLSRNCNR